MLSFFLQGIVKALQEYQKKLLEHKVEIYVRRGGPNYQEGLRVMREVGKACTVSWIATDLYLKIENHPRNTQW